MGRDVDSQQKRGSQIVIRDLTKRYANAASPAVDSVDLNIEPGEFIVLLGPSGCGKTTLLKMINRIYEPTSGTIEIDGQNVLELNPTNLRRQIGYVIQQTGLFPHMKVAENIAVVPSLLKWPKDRTRERVRELLELVGLDPDSYSNRYPTQLSGGEQQRVGLARALAVSPPTMLMDEPFGALDAITRRRLQEELVRIHQRISQTVLFVTHDIEEAVQLADRIVILRDGKVVQVGTPLEIVQTPADDFVSDLVGSRDVLRRFSLITVGDVMDNLPADQVADVPTVERSAFVREALGLLAESGAPYLLVTDADQPVGSISFSAIQRAAAPSESSM